jgi:hypothetical protein
MPGKRKRDADDDEGEGDEGDNEGDEGDNEGEEEDVQIMGEKPKAESKAESKAEPKPKPKPKPEAQPELATWEQVMTQTSLKGTTKSKILKAASIVNLAIRNELLHVYNMYVLHTQHPYFYAGRHTHRHTHSATHTQTHTYTHTHVHSHKAVNAKTTKFDKLAKTLMDVVIRPE